MRATARRPSRVRQVLTALTLIAAMAVLAVGCGKKHAAATPEEFKPWLDKAPAFTAQVFRGDRSLAFPTDYAGKWVWLMVTSAG